MINWTCTKTKKPNNNQFVLAVIDSVFVNIAQYRDGIFYDVMKDENGHLFETVSRDVSHWMPLPELPEDI